MKKLYTLFAAFALCSGTSFSQQWYQAGFGGNILYDICFTSTDTGYAVGAAGTVRKTTNAGIAWTSLNTGTNEYLWDIFFTDANTGYVVGENATIIKTIDAGASWTTLTSGLTTGDHLTSVFFTDANTGYVAGRFGYIRKTIDAGATWSAQTSGTNNNLESIYFVDANTGYAVGAAGTIRQTTNGGSFWSAMSSGTTNLLYSVYFTGPATGYAVGLNGTILNYTGSVWTGMSSGTASYLLDIYFVGNIGYASGGSGTILKYNGSSWSPLTSGTTQDLWAVNFTDATTGYVVGTNGIILKTCNLTANAGSDKSVCDNLGGADLGAYPAATGGTTPYSYLWSPGANLTDSTIEHPVANPASYTPYSLTVTDAGGCTATDAMNLYINATPTAGLTSSSNVTCSGACNGSASVNANGGTSPYSYSWSNTATTSSVSGLCANNYTCVVTGGNGCADTVFVSITQPSGLSINTSITHVTCNGGNDGAITLIVGGGVSPYSYLWSNSATTVTISNLVAGTYSATVTDANGCTATVNPAVNEPPVLAAPFTSTAPQCLGNSVDFSNLGANATSFSWNFGSGATPATSTLENPTGIMYSIAGIKTIIFTVANACGTASDTTVILINELPAVLISPQTNVSCFGGSDGTLTANPGGLNYLWSNGGNLQTANNLATGTYYVTVTDPSTGCSDSASTTITEPSVLGNSFSIIDVSCTGGNNGSISLTTTGGVSPYSYLWDNGQTSATSTGLIAGNYNATVTDSNGCTLVNGGPVTEPLIALSGSVSSTNVSCFGGSNGTATANGSGGTAPYSYLWFNGNTAQTISNLAAGTYNVTISDANGCGNLQYSATVTEPPLLSVSASSTSPVCLGQSVSLTSSATGGTSPYSFYWTVGGQTTPTITETPSINTIYDVSVTDANGCMAPANTTVVVNALPTANAGLDDTVCTLSDTVFFTGGGGVTYSWAFGDGQTSTLQNPSHVYSSANTYNVGLTVTDANGCFANDAVLIHVSNGISSSATSTNVSCFGGSDGTATAFPGGYLYNWSSGSNLQNMSGLSAGTYSVTVTEQILLCSSVSSVIITEPLALIADAGIDASICAGTSAVIGGTPAANGGTSPYTYNWNPPTGLSSVTIDNPIASPTSTQTYTLNITDANGCNSSDLVTVTVTPAPTVNAGADVSVCADNPNVNLSGTSSTGSQIWTTTGTGSFTNATAPNPSYIPDATDISAGTVTIVFTSTNNGNCSSVSDTLVITFMPSPTVNAGTDASVCDGTSATLSASGAISYLWSNSSTSSSITVTPSVSTGYSVVGTDVNGCSASDTVNVTVNLNPTATAYTVNTISCNGGSDGEVAVAASSGTTPYSYLWNTGATTITVTGLIADTFNVTVTDANGCWVESYTIITEPSILNFDIPGSNVVINEGQSAGFSVVASGGASPYSYLWSNGLTTATIGVTPTTTTTYTVTVTDANNCSNSNDDSVIVFVNQIYFSIYGTIYNMAHDTTLNNGTVYLFPSDSLFQLVPVDSFILAGSNGDYVFNNHLSDQYIILFKPDNAIYPDAIPTYFGDTTSWLGAQIINLISDTGGIDISTREVPQLMGTGFISGFIQFGIGSGKTGNGNVIPFGDPVPGIDVELEQVPGGIVRYTTTNDSGMFSFSSLPVNSTYKLYVDIPGLPMDSTYEVTLSPSDSTANNLDYVVDTTSGSGGIFIGFPLGSSEFGVRSSELMIFPNPNDGNFIVSCNWSLVSGSIIIYNLLGEKVYQYQVTRNKKLSTNLNSGIYFVQLISENGIMTKRIVIE